MKALFLLSKEDLKLAYAEFRAVMKKEFKAEGNILIADCDEEDIKKAKKRLAYTNSVFRFLFSCKTAELEAKMRDFDWQPLYHESFVIRTINGNKIKPEAEYAGFVWKKVKNPKVDLKEAKTKIFIICGRKIYVGIFLGETDKSYLERKAAMKPSLHPTAINPKLAKAMVNLTGAEKNETICDPFCGTGGILVEAGLMGMKTIGCDISKKMLAFAEKNMEHYKVKYFHLQEDDATKARIKCDYVVTDLPYGRNSEITKELDKLYLDFLLNIKKWKIKKAVICFPDFVDYKKIIKSRGFSIEEEFENYVHKSLTKKIIVLK
jgi:tRNA (guanine10-N2)-dimethyltransferase